MSPRSKTLSALAATLLAGNASAEIETQVHAGYSNAYLWRGLHLGNDLIETGVDSSTEWNDISLSAGAWYANFQTAGEHLDELDLYAEASKDFEWVKGSIGYIAYLYPNSNGSTYQEISFGVSRDLGFATASLKYFWGVQGENYDYTEFALSKSFKLHPRLNLGVDSNIGYRLEEGQATAWTTKLTLAWDIFEHTKLSPFVALSIPLGDDPDTDYSNSHSEFVAGSMLSYTF